MVLRIRAFTTFNRKVIKQNWKRMHKRPMTRAGLLVRQIARRSIKVRKGNKPSPKGVPPRSRAASKPYKLIFSVTNNFATRVIVGPVRFGKQSGVTTPELHEFGKSATRTIITRKGVKQGRTTKGRFKKIQTVMVRARVKYPKRATMRPALKVARPKLPALWKNSFSR